MQHRAGILLFVLIAALAPANPSPAADYPTKPITLINPNAPGGGHDAVARAFATVAEKMLGQPMVVINKAGASTMLGMSTVAQAPPDGYTLGVDSTTTTNALEWELANGRKPPLTRADLVPIGGLTVNLPLIIVPTNSPWKTVADMVKDLKAKPGHYAFCSGGSTGEPTCPSRSCCTRRGRRPAMSPTRAAAPASPPLSASMSISPASGLRRRSPLPRGRSCVSSPSRATNG